MMDPSEPAFLFRQGLGSRTGPGRRSHSVTQSVGQQHEEASEILATRLPARSRPTSSPKKKILFFLEAGAGHKLRATDNLTSRHFDADPG